MKDKQNGELPPPLSQLPASTPAAKAYTLSDAERQHVAEISATMQSFQDEILRLKGVILDKQTELDLMRRHLRLTFGMLAQAHGLPMGAQLTPDGMRLIAREN
jgi:hypothetical protein